MSIARCNICGIPEDKWKSGRCYECGNGRYCDKCWQKAKKSPGTSSSMRVYWKRKASESHPSCAA